MAKQNLTESEIISLAAKHEHVTYTKEEIRLKLVQSVMNVRNAKKLDADSVIIEAQKLFDWVYKSYQYL
jgi:hypothetical protein